MESDLIILNSNAFKRTGYKGCGINCLHETIAYSESLYFWPACNKTFAFFIHIAHRPHLEFSRAKKVTVKKIIVCQINIYIEVREIQKYYSRIYNGYILHQNHLQYINVNCQENMQKNKDEEKNLVFYIVSLLKLDSID